MQQPDDAGVFDDDAWVLEEPAAYDWEPPSDTEEGDPGFEESDTEAPHEPAIAEEEASKADEEDDEPEGEFETSWEYQPPSVPPSQMPAAGGPDGGSSEDEVPAAAPVEYLLEPSDDADQMHYAPADPSTTVPAQPADDAQEDDAYDDGGGAEDGGAEGSASDESEMQWQLDQEEAAAPLDYDDDDASVALDDSAFELVAAPKFEPPPGYRSYNLSGEKPAGHSYMRAKAAEKAEAAKKVTRVPLAPKYGGEALVDERSQAFAHELPALRSSLRALGPVGQELQALALKAAAQARRTHKHTPQAQRAVVSETEWWDTLLAALGLPSLAALGDALTTAPVR